MFYNLPPDKDVPGGMTFQGVSGNTWCTEAVRVISALGIVNNNSVGAFRPNATAARTQVATDRMLGRAADQTYSASRPDGRRYFADAPATGPSWRQPTPTTTPSSAASRIGSVSGNRTQSKKEGALPPFFLLVFGRSESLRALSFQKTAHRSLPSNGSPHWSGHGHPYRLWPHFTRVC